VERLGVQVCVYFCYFTRLTDWRVTLLIKVEFVELFCGSIIVSTLVVVV